jgi:hypothetical protein
MRNTIAVAAGLALTLTSAGAWAQEFGNSGTFAISAERVFGFFYEDIDWDPPGPGSGSDEYTTFGFGWGDPHTMYTVPRFAVDYFVIDSLSVGGTLAYYHSDRDDDNNNNGDDDWSGFLFAPRVGYAITIADMAGFWPRGGFTYVNHDDPDYDELALTIEAMFWLSPAEGMAFVLGPTLDLGITGEADPDTDINTTVIGVSVGLMGWL